MAGQRLQIRRRKRKSLIILGLLVAGLIAGAPLAKALSGDITVEGTVPSEPPTQAAVITQPISGQTFSKPTITVVGTCTGDTIVEIYKNNVFAGSGICDNGHFSVSIDLFIGPNTLIAKIKDSLGQYGPDSAPVNVTYTPATPLPVNPGGGGQGSTVTQLLLLVDADYRGVFPGKRLIIRPSILGGTPPYAIKIDWGDGSEDIIARKSNGLFEASHIYAKPGVMIIKISASDNQDQKAFVQTVAIVNGRLEEDRQDADTIISRVSQNIWWWVILIILFLILGILIGLWLHHRHDRRKNRKNDQKSELAG